MFITKGTIEALLVQLGRSHQVIQGCGIKTLRPEDQHRLIQNSVDIKFSWSCHNIFTVTVIDQLVNKFVYMSLHFYSKLIDILFKHGKVPLFRIRIDER